MNYEVLFFYEVSFIYLFLLDFSIRCLFIFKQLKIQDSFFRLTTCPNKGIAFLEEDCLIGQLYAGVMMEPGKEQNGLDFVFNIFSQSSHIFSHERN